MESKKAFGNYIKAKRIEICLTQREFADKLYVTESAVSKWERGLSYPDITLITAICNILCVSEHELLTASEDVLVHKQERLAKSYLKLIKNLKILQIVLYGVALLNCFIVNLAVSHTLSWFFLVLTSIALAASLTLLPLFLTKHRGILTLGCFLGCLILLLAACAIYSGGSWLGITVISVLFGFSIIFLPFVLSNISLPNPFYLHKALIYLIWNSILLFLLLFCVERYTDGDWFFGVALPLAIFYLLLPWEYLIVFRYTRLKALLKVGVSLLITTIIMFFSNGFTNYVLGNEFKILLSVNLSNWTTEEMINNNVNLIVVLSLLLFSVIITTAGIIKLFLSKNNQSQK